MDCWQSGERGRFRKKGIIGILLALGTRMPVRRSVIWRSDAFTTSVGLLDLYEAQRWFPRKFDCESTK